MLRLSINLLIIFKKLAGYPSLYPLFVINLFFLFSKSIRIFVHGKLRTCVMVSRCTRTPQPWFNRIRLSFIQNSVKTQTKTQIIKQDEIIVKQHQAIQRRKIQQKIITSKCALHCSHCLLGINSNIYPLLFFFTSFIHKFILYCSFLS